MPRTRLTDKQHGFVCSIIAGEFDNAVQAYEAHYDTSRMKPATTKRAAYTLLAHPRIAELIQEARVSALEQAHVLGAIGLEEVTARLMEIADTWRGEYHEVDEHGLITTVNKGMTGHPSAAVTALVTIAKLHGLVIDRSEKVTEKGGTLIITGLPEPEDDPTPSLQDKAAFG